MRFATMATGGIGGYLAVRLTEAGHEVAAIARGAHLAAIRESGLTLETGSGNSRVQPWMATDDTAGVRPVDVVVFGVKGDALEAAAEACRPMLGPDTLVVPFLNGVEASDRLARILPEHNVGNGVAQVSTTILSPGVIGQTGTFNTFRVAERDSRPSERVDRLRAAIDEAGASSPPTDDIERDLWSKFIFFSAMSGVTAAARCRLREILANPALSDLFKGVMAETAALARARGVAIPDDAVEKGWAVINGMTGDVRASTAVDLEHGRPLEIEWVSGAVRRLSGEAGLEAPLNGALYAVLSPYKDGAG